VGLLVRDFVSYAVKELPECGLRESCLEMLDVRSLVRDPELNGRVVALRARGAVEVE
jgi:hypothetical protein